MNELADLEAQAKAHLNNAVNSWMQFVQVAIIIRDNKLYSEGTWSEYCRATFNIDSSRIRQYEAALPYAERIQSLSDGINCPEGHIRKLKQAISFDDPLMLSVHNFGGMVAQSIGVAPTTAIYKHTYAVLAELQDTGYVDIGIGQIAPVSSDAIQVAVLTSLGEARNRLSDRLGHKTRYNGIMHRVANSHYELAIEGENLPLEARVTVYIQDENNGI